MSAPLIPASYDEWRLCITVLCGIPLTSGFIEQRLTALANPNDHVTRRYRELWGDEQLSRIRLWFVQARDDLAE